MAFVDSVNLLTGPLTNGQNILERDEREEMWVFIPLLPRSWDTEGGCLSELKVSMQSTASPSRLLSLMDPLLPLSVLSKCVSAYAGATIPGWESSACMPCG